jgi:hypothetical protein
MRKILSLLVLCTVTLTTVLLSCGGGGGGGNTGNTGSSSTAPNPVASPRGTQYTWSASNTPKVSYVMPEGLQLTRDGSLGWVTMERSWGTSGNYDYGQCKIALVHVTDTENTDLDTLALQAFTQAFLSVLSNGGNIFGIDPSSWIGIVAQNGGTSYSDFINTSDHQKGISGQGWNYVDMRGKLRQPSGPNYFNPVEEARILMAQLDSSHYVAMIGYTFKDMYPDISCLDDVSGNVASNWIMLIHSLSFPDYQATDPAALRKAVIGSWFGSEIGTYISIFWGYVFAANGHSLEVEGNSQYTQLPGSNDIYEVTSSWSGNGSWQLNGSKLSVWPDSGQPYTKYVRYYQEGSSTPSGTGFTYLKMLGECTKTINGVDAPVFCEGWSTKD